MLEKLSPIRSQSDRTDEAFIKKKSGGGGIEITDEEVIASLFVRESLEKQPPIKCPFYYKIGACRHAERCTKLHREPASSPTVLLKNFYWSPLNQFKSFSHITPLHQYTVDELQQHFDDTYEELYVELERKYGELEELLICDNIAEHLAGNAYAKFRFEEDAERAVLDLNNRWFNLKPIYAELSPVVDVEQARCQHEFEDCPRNGHCNFWHIKQPSSRLRRKLRRFRRQQQRIRSSRRKSRSRSRSLPWLSELYVKRLCDSSRSRSKSASRSSRTVDESSSRRSSSRGRDSSSRRKKHRKHKSRKQKRR